MGEYKPGEIEPKWQARWREAKLHATAFDQSRPKYYALDMFPYPSGAGLHVGHCEGYTATDIITRWKRMQGFNVLHPMGWDAFGLPAENFAIKTGIHPKITTEKAVANFRRQIDSVGFCYDWDREINTTAPEYYKWTQWIFLLLFKRGLAYEIGTHVKFTILAGSHDLGDIGSLHEPIASEHLVEACAEFTDLDPTLCLYFRHPLHRNVEHDHLLMQHLIVLEIVQQRCRDDVGIQ